MSTVTRLPIKVIPGAREDAVVGWLGDRLRLRVGAAPERGRANAAVVALIADRLGLPRGAVSVISGHTSPRKLVEISGLDRREVEARLGVRR